MQMMLFMRRLTAVYGVCLGLWLAGGSVQADPWHSEQGLASYYSKGFHGRKTASGERFSQHEMTAAHRQLPLGTKVIVENRETGEQVEIKITDRGPYADKKRRIIDLSKAAADSIGLVKPGVGPCVSSSRTRPRPRKSAPMKPCCTRSR